MHLKQIETKYFAHNNTIEISTDELFTNNIYIVKLMKSGE